jgi:Pyruvate/2-oxoacid:ferredoxin oxidoreductase gamma subunit
MGVRINTIMQTCFFAISGVLPREEAIAAIKHAIEKTYGKRGERVATLGVLPKRGLFGITNPRLIQNANQPWLPILRNHRRAFGRAGRAAAQRDQPAPVRVVGNRSTVVSAVSFASRYPVAI